ncbi:CNH-domain-containing protein [Daedaleopsis nitida]|nr:CNH-domain-containing protein [Daedaleopsis nitida]
MTKPKGRGDDVKYVVWKPPVRLEFLSLASPTVRPVQRSNTLSRMMRPSRDSLDSFEHASDAFPTTASHIHANYHPISFQSLGKSAGAYTLYAPTQDERDEWRRKMKEAVAATKAAQAENSVFSVETITSDTASSQDTPAHHPGLVTGRISCTLPFAANDGRELIAIGSEDGVWIGDPRYPESIQRVISLRLVTQLAYLSAFGFFVFLADKSLYAIGIESVVPTNNEDPTRPPFGLQKLNDDDKAVRFFSVGRQDRRTLILYMVKKGLDSVFRVLEVLTTARDHGVLSILQDSAGTRFKVGRDFFIPSDSYDLLFLKSKVCILCPSRFEIMDLSGFASVTIPQEDDLRRLGKRPASSKPIAMFRIREGEFLLCYDEYGLYVDKRGDPSRSPPIIEWEGVAVHAAWHPPYVLLFGDSFIEVRHVESGRLAQVITGHAVRCVWDGRGVVRPEGQDEFDDPRTPRIHAVLEGSETSAISTRLSPQFGAHSRSVPRRQHVVVLNPTERLVVPGTRYSPSLLSVADTLPPYVP